MRKDKNVPVLRFMGFKETWQEKRLGEIAKTSSGGTPSRSMPIYWNGKYPWITTSLIDFKTIFHSNEYITAEGIKNSSAKLFPIGTILMALYGQGKTRGKVALLGIEATTNQACLAISPHKQTVNEVFLFQNLAGRYDEVRNLSNSGGQENLSAELIKNVRFFLPSLPEQQKIAAFLTAIDTRLQQLTRKKALLEQYKKGVMQHIFSRQLRFKDEAGREFPEWEEKAFSKLATFSKGKGISKSDIIENGLLECIRYGELYTHYGEVITEIKSRTNINPKELVLSEVNDVIIPASGETQLDIAKASCVLRQGVALGGDLNIIKTGMNGVFLAYYLNCVKRKDIASLAQGNSVVHLYPNQLRTLLIEFPSLPEQQKIAAFLTALDAKIHHVGQQITHTQAYKKGLLQQMFV